MNLEANPITNITDVRQKIQHLFPLNKISEKDIEDLNKLDRGCLAQTCTEIVHKLKGVERDNFLDKIDLIIPASTKSDIWEYNHSVISSAVAGFMCQHGTMPTKNAIAEKTGLSRQTVAKHLKEYQRHPEFTTEMEQFNFMVPNVLASVFKFAINGDMRAARLYFEMVGAVNKKHTSTVVNKQNNYIQINNTILSQENLNELTTAQLNQIENIITNKK